MAKYIFVTLLKKVIDDRNGKRKLSRMEDKWRTIDWEKVCTAVSPETEFRKKNSRNIQKKI